VLFERLMANEITSCALNGAGNFFVVSFLLVSQPTGMLVALSVLRIGDGSDVVFESRCSHAKS
jgi:hypothetical protein